MTTAELADRRCTACAEGTPPLDEGAATELMGRLDPSWSIDGNRAIRRALEFPNFRNAFAFATAIALLAESEGHHPDLVIGWGRVVVELTTHAAGGLTDNDFIIAAKVDRLRSRA